MENIQQLLKKEGIGEKIGEGCSGKVYRIGKTDYVVKVARINLETKASAARRFEKEERISDRLHSVGVSVPKPEGVFGIKNPETGEYVPCFVMEYIPSKNIGRNRLKVHEKYSEEKEKAAKEVLEINDTRIDHNVLWCPSRDRVYLIDFGFWKEKAMALNG